MVCRGGRGSRAGLPGLSGLGWRFLALSSSCCDRLRTACMESFLSGIRNPWSDVVPISPSLRSAAPDLPVGEAGHCKAEVASAGQPCSTDSENTYSGNTLIIAGSPPKRKLGDIVTRASLMERLGNAEQIRNTHLHLIVQPGASLVAAYRMPRGPTPVRPRLLWNNNQRQRKRRDRPASVPGGFGAGWGTPTPPERRASGRCHLTHHCSDGTPNKCRLDTSLPRFQIPRTRWRGRNPVPSFLSAAAVLSRVEKGSWWLGHRTNTRLHLP